jgi:hypothetical protein
VAYERHKLARLYLQVQSFERGYRVGLVRPVGERDVVELDHRARAAPWLIALFLVRPGLGSRRPAAAEEHHAPDDDDRDYRGQNGLGYGLRQDGRDDGNGQQPE